ncbi:MAG: class I SAM-dependent methyltransferase [Alphaproteobacteria bacterium]|nr:class I SAM-dependent methyltransferase [Alphaproteobacteria bacterium]
MALITDNYRDLNRHLHESNPEYGTSAHKWAAQIAPLIEQFESRSVLDYGCGKQTLHKALAGIVDGKSIAWQNYDPAIEGLDTPPDPADFVVCSDVLEHIEPDCLDAVLDDLRRCTLKACFLLVATGPAVKTLADGRNAHLIIESYEWWLPRLWARFRLYRFIDLDDDLFMAVVTPKSSP